MACRGSGVRVPSAPPGIRWNRKGPSVFSFRGPRHCGGLPAVCKEPGTDSHQRQMWFKINRLLAGRHFLPSMFGAVAQLVAHLHGMQGVRGSSPLSSTEEVLLTERDLVCF